MALSKVASQKIPLNSAATALVYYNATRKGLDSPKIHLYKDDLEKKINQYELEYGLKGAGAGALASGLLGLLLAKKYGSNKEFKTIKDLIKMFGLSAVAGGMAGGFGGMALGHAKANLDYLKSKGIHVKRFGARSELTPEAFERYGLGAVKKLGYNVD